MSIYKQLSMIKYISGGCWILTAICGYCNNSVTDAIKITIQLAVLLFILIYAVITKTDPVEHEKLLAVAKAKAASVVFYSCCLMAVLTPAVYLLFDGREWNWMLIMTYTFFILLGIIDISTGIALGRMAKHNKAAGKDFHRLAGKQQASGNREVS